MATIQPVDLELIHELRKTGVLENVDAYRINGDGRNIVVMCSDGHQSSDQISTHSNYVRREGCTDHCCHPHMLNGGALLLSPRFTKRSRLPVRQVLESQLRQSMTLKGANIVALYVHAPCGAAFLRKLSFADVLDRLFDAKQRVKKIFAKRRKFHLVCFVQVDYGDKKRTYFISRKKWETWKAAHAKIEQAIQA